MKIKVQKYFSVILLITFFISTSKIQAHYLSVIPNSFEFLTNTEMCSANDRIFDVLFSSDSQYVVASNWRSNTDDPWKARMWEVDTGEVVQDFDYSNQYATYATSIALSPDGKYILTGGGSNASLWETNTGMLTYTLPREIKDTQGTTVLFTPNSRYAVTAGFDGASVWDVISGNRLSEFQAEMDQTSNQFVRISPDGRYIMTFDLTKNEAHISNIETGELIKKFEGVVTGIFSPEDQYIALYGNHELSLWDAKTFNPLNILDSEQQRIIDWRFSADGKYLLVISDQFRLWDTETGKSILEVPLNDLANVYGILPNNQQLVLPQPQVGDSPHKVDIRDIPSGKLIIEFEMENSDISTFDFSSNGKYLVVGTFQGEIQLWDIQKGKKMREFC